MITSRANGKLKNVKKLLNSGKERNRQGLFVVEGKKMFSEIPDGMTEEVYVSESFDMTVKKQTENPDNIAESFEEKVSECKNGIEIVSDDIFKSLSDTVTPQGIIAVVRQPHYDAESIIKEAKKDATFVLLDDIRDPGNLGTILRTSEAAGVHAVLMSPDCADIFNPKVIRATMGSIFRMKYAICDLDYAIKLLKETGVKIIGTSPDAKCDHKTAPYGNKNAFIIGNEANGVRKEILDQADFNVNIAMKGRVESLNAAVSLAILLFR